MAHTPCRTRNVLAVLALVALVVALVLALAACGEGEGDTSGETPVADILKIADDGLVTTWDPRAVSSGEIEFVINLYEPLVWANPEGGSGDERYIPALAESWEVSDDGLEYTFKLRQGVTFHDGEPMNADAVKYSIEATIELGLGYAYLWTELKSIEVIDDYTVKFTLNKSIPLLDICAAEYGAFIFSPATKGKPQGWWDTPNEAGTGPYMLESYKPEQEIVLKQNPDYWGGWKDNQFKTLVFQVAAEDTTAQQLLESGQVDWSNVIPYDQVETLKANPELFVEARRGLTNAMVWLNCAREPTSNKLVRQALSYATPTEDIIQAAVGGFATPSAGIIPVGLWPRSDKIGPYPYDLEKAKQLLAEAGYADGFDIEMLYGSGAAEDKITMTLIKESYAEIGVNVKLKEVAFNTAIEQLQQPDHTKAPYSFITFWYPAIPNGYDSMAIAFNTDSSWNLSFWYNDEWEAMNNEAFATESTDPEGAQALYDEVQQILYDECPMLFLYDNQRIVLSGADINADPRSTNQFYPNATQYYFITLQ